MFSVPILWREGRRLACYELACGAHVGLPNGRPKQSNSVLSVFVRSL